MRPAAIALFVVLSAALVAVAQPAAEAIAQHLERAPIRRLRPLARGGRTLEMRLDAPVDAALVPATRDDPDGWRHEIAAHRIAACIGMDNVPVAVYRPLSRAELERTLDPDFADVSAELARVMRFDGDAVPAAAVHRPADARPSGLGNWRVLERRLAMLRQRNEVTADRARQVGDLAHAILFDYLIANPSRYDGAPIPGTPNASRLYLVDHANAFAAPLPEELHERVRERLHRVEKAGRWFAEGLLRCDERTLRAALSAGDPVLLDAAELRGVLDRREALISLLVTLRDEHGEDAVFVLP